MVLLPINRHKIELPKFQHKEFLSAGLQFALRIISMAKYIVAFLFHVFHIYHMEAFDDTRIIMARVYATNVSTNFEAGDVPWFNSRVNDMRSDSSSKRVFLLINVGTRNRVE